MLALSGVSILKGQVPWQDGRRMARAQNTSTLDPAEIARFDEISAHWWNPNGEFRPLHAMNPARVGYIRDQVAAHRTTNDASNGASKQPADVQLNGPLAGMRLADIGCGGGLLSEPMARMGAQVTGVDASERAIEVARDHADRQALAIDYRCCMVEDLAVEAPEQFDIVTCLEIVEHVADVDAFVSSVATLLKPGGLAFFSTLNRTAKSFAVAIAGAEYLLRLLPRGTHDWRRFLRPEELDRTVGNAGLVTQNVSGMIYSPVSRSWRLSKRRLAVNYLLTAVKPSANLMG